MLIAVLLALLTQAQALAAATSHLLRYFSREMLHRDGPSGGSQWLLPPAVDRSATVTRVVRSIRNDPCSNRNASERSEAPCTAPKRRNTL
jgi:hypothetical protein